MATLLIVDDDTLIRETLHDLLSPAHECHTADRAEQALAYLEMESYDVVLTDINMPGLSGHEILKNIQANHLNTPVIVISGMTDETNEQALMDLGAFACFTKPFKLEEIEDAVVRAIARHQELIGEDRSKPAAPDSDQPNQGQTKQRVEEELMSAVTQPAPINEDKMNAFLGKVVGDFGAALSSSLAYIGQKLGLYKALASSGPSTPQELAANTSTNERYVREWLINQATGGYVDYDPASGRYSLAPEQAVALTDESSPFYVGGGFFVVKAMTHAVSRIEESFKNGGGMLWGEHDPDLFVGVERFFRPGYAAHLIASWIPSLNGVKEKLEAGGKVADIGCGHGSSTIIMAQAYPNSRFWGFDNHEKSIETARQRAEDAGVSDRVTFAVANASELPDQQFDMVAFFDCLHDMGDPVGACKRAAEVLAPDGSALIVEPMAGNTVEENFNIIGRTFSGASTLCCTSNSLALNGPALGAVAPESAIREVVLAGGFTQFRRATETPFNRIFEARK